MGRSRYAPDFDALAEYGATDPTGYLTDVPLSLRQLTDARSAAQTGAEVDSRNRVNRNFDALGAGVAFLSSPDASRDEMQLLMRQRGAKEREQSAKDMAERVDLYGTAERYQARNRAAEGGVYREDADVNRLLRSDPAALLAELAAQQPQAPAEASGDVGGTFSVIGGGDPRSDARAARLAELLGLAQHATSDRQAKDAKAAAKLPPGEKERRYFEAEAAAVKGAEAEGVDTIIQAIRERAARDPDTAAIAGKLIQQLRNRRLKEKDLAHEVEGLDGASIFGPDGELLGARLPAHRGQAALIKQLREERQQRELEAAAERGYP